MIEVIKAGLYTTVQDLGRLEHLQYGVPISGSMDAFAAQRANSILNNKREDALLEMTMVGPTLRFTTKTTICLSGADMSPKCNGQPIRVNTVIPILPGDLLSFGELKYGCRAYLAVSGGVLTPKILGSRSMYPGITGAHRLLEGDTLAIKEGIPLIQPGASLRIDKKHFLTNTLTVFEGPEYDMLTREQKNMIQSQRFVISNTNNRMAYQLKTPFPNTLEPIISSLVLPGTVQLTPSGRIIILMRDCQTTGGYPRILQLQQEAINILSQKLVNDTVSFNLIER